jgi:hypothetical protein
MRLRPSSFPISKSFSSGSPGVIPVRVNLMETLGNYDPVNAVR